MSSQQNLLAEYFDENQLIQSLIPTITHTNTDGTTNDVTTQLYIVRQAAWVLKTILNASDADLNGYTFAPIIELITTYNTVAPGNRNATIEAVIRKYRRIVVQAAVAEIKRIKDSMGTPVGYGLVDTLANDVGGAADDVATRLAIVTCFGDQAGLALVTLIANQFNQVNAKLSTKDLELLAMFLNMFAAKYAVNSTAFNNYIVRLMGQSVFNITLAAAALAGNPPNPPNPPNPDTFDLLIDRLNSNKLSAPKKTLLKNLAAIIPTLVAGGSVANCADRLAAYKFNQNMPRYDNPIVLQLIELNTKLLFCDALSINGFVIASQAEYSFAGAMLRSGPGSRSSQTVSGTYTFQQNKDGFVVLSQDSNGAKTEVDITKEYSTLLQGDAKNACAFFGSTTNVGADQTGLCGELFLTCINGQGDINNIDNKTVKACRTLFAKVDEPSENLRAWDRLPAEKKQYMAYRILLGMGFPLVHNNDGNIDFNHVDEYTIRRTFDLKDGVGATPAGVAANDSKNKKLVNYILLLVRTVNELKLSNKKSSNSLPVTKLFIPTPLPVQILHIVPGIPSVMRQFGGSQPNIEQLIQKYELIKNNITDYQRNKISTFIINYKQFVNNATGLQELIDLVLKLKAQHPNAELVYNDQEIDRFRAKLGEAVNKINSKEPKVTQLLGHPIFVGI